MSKKCIEYAKIPLEVILNKKLSKIDVLVFWNISLFCHENMKFYMKNTSLASRLNISKSSVSRSISRLKRLSYIKEDPDGKHRRCIVVDKKYKERHKDLVAEFNKRRNLGNVKFLIIPLVVLLNKKLNLTDCLVFAYVRLMDVSPEYHCWQGNNTLAKVLGVDKGNFSRSIDRLCKLGLLERVQKEKAYCLAVQKFQYVNGTVLLFNKRRGFKPPITVLAENRC